MPGVNQVEGNFGAERVSVAFDPARVSTAQMKRAISSAGYRIEERKYPGAQDTEDLEAAARRAEIRDLGRRVAVGAVLTAPVLVGVMGSFFGASWIPSILTNNWFQLAAITPVMLYTGWPIHHTGWLAIRHRSADMNSLITIGSTAAFAYSLFVTCSRAPCRQTGTGGSHGKVDHLDPHHRRWPASDAQDLFERKGDVPDAARALVFLGTG